MKVIFEMIKKKFPKYSKKKISTFLFFFLLSGSLWFILALNKNYVDFVKLNINYKNIPEDIVIVNTLTKYINIKVKGTGGKIILYQLNLKKTYININLEKFFTKKEEKEDSLIISGDKLKQLVIETLNDLNVINIKPDEIIIKYTTLKRKFVKVIPSFKEPENLIEPQYGLSGNIKVIPEKVEVFGPPFILDTLNFIYTEVIRIKNLKDTFISSFKIQNIDNVKIGTTKEVKIIIPVDRIIESKVVKEIKVLNVPENYILQLFPATVTINFKIPMSVAKNKDEIMLQPYVNFREINNSNTVDYLNVFLVDTFPFINDISIVPDKVEFILKKIK